MSMLLGPSKEVDKIAADGQADEPAAADDASADSADS
jgi:hypothetical protein